MDSASVLRRFGSGEKVLEELDSSEKDKKKYVKKVVDLKRRFDSTDSFWKRNDFIRSLKRRIEQDFAEDEVVVVDGWVLAETEVGLFTYNTARKSGRL
jgi:hypothetical protein